MQLLSYNKRKRIVKKFEGGNNVKMDRLERFEKALNDIVDEYIKLGKELEKLRNDGKMKTSKFRELLGRKLVYSMIITIFKRYDLIDFDNRNFLKVNIKPLKGVDKKII